MVNSKTEMSTSNTLGDEYQVFLSFRGLDTRRGFTNSLYHALVDVGIRVFIDDEELRLGEGISGNLLQAIDDSKLYIPIFSKNYASSHWCLHELAKMVENTSKSKEGGNEKVILPIFYDVKPDDVKLKTALYNNAIGNLEQKMEGQKKKFSFEDVEAWQQALKEVDGTKGWELQKYLGYGDLIKSVVNEVVVRLKTRQRQVTKDLVGMTDRIAAINNLLDIDSGGVRLIGIYGMSGIGKTTLAKIIFNELCPQFGKNCSFLDDVRETAKTKGLVELQGKLLSDISYSRVAHNIGNMDQGITMIGATICNKKVLIVLDDVDEGNQIQGLIGMNSLSPGTRILVTTRDKSILKIRGFKYEILAYEMEGLSEKDALQLFSKHAFDNNSPLADYYALSKGIVSTTGGLPLALESIGSLLFGQEGKMIWEEMLEKLRETPNRDVLGKLRISYDTLEMDQQQIFLDIACFYIGQKKIDPIYVWRDCGFKAEYAIHVLINRCMIKILDDNSLWMHDLFRDLGRTIAIQERTRLWNRDNIICELRSSEIKGSIQALCLRGKLGNPIIVTAEQIKRFPHLQFLWLDHVIWEGDFTGCLSKMKWINLQYSSYRPREPSLCYYLLPDRYKYQYKYHPPTNLCLENLVVVNLSRADFNEDEVSYLIKRATKLKVLTLQYVWSMHRTPSFPEYSVLEKLTIYNCPCLMEIDCSIGKLRCLTDLRVESCLLLRKLPQQVGELQNLQHLSLMNCDHLRELPNSLSKLESLTKLDVSHTGITRLPNSIGKLPMLSSANVSHTPIAEMPSTMSKFLCLQTLDLDHCHSIKELPKLPISLTTLRLRSSSLMNIPNLSYLTNLVELLLSDDSEEATATSNVIPTCDLWGFERLSKLSKLHFCLSNVRTPTTEWGSLSLLKELTLHGLDLQILNQFPPNLTFLDVNRTLNGLPPSETEIAFGSLSLRKPRENKVYEQLDVQFLDVLETLETSRIRDCKSSKRFVCLPEELGFNELQAPELTDRRGGAFLVPSSLKMLQEFHIHECPEVRDIIFVSTLESLEVFSVGKCISLKRLGGLSNLKNLKKLCIYECKSLQVVEGIDGTEFLHTLIVHGCRSMEKSFYMSCSKIPNECLIDIEDSGDIEDNGELLDSGMLFHNFLNWESYIDKILNGTK